MAFETRGDAIPEAIVKIWQDVVDSISKLLAVPSVMINRLYPPDLEVFRSNHSETNPFPSGTRMPMAGVYCEAAARRREMVQVQDARKDPQWADSPTAKAGIFAYLGFPVFWPDGEVFGTICAVDTQENKWGAQAEDLLRTFKRAIEAHLALVITNEQLHQKNRELESALGEVKELRGLLPICAGCKKIRDDKGYWGQIECYLMEHANVQITHGLCPECAKRLYPDIPLHDG